MNGARLKSLVIENFRSLRGTTVVPLDAQVVLLHGTNGMGKTSVLSALELCLTGKIAHLAADGDTYKSYLTTLGAGEGSVALTTTAPYTEGGAVDGSLAFTDSRFIANPLLTPDGARHFTERCYLPQATLGRLLEIYNDQKTGTNSPLTLFVKELLGLDPLDALVDGLDPAFHVSRVRKMVPQYRQLDALKASLEDQIKKTDRAINEAKKAAEERRVRINEMVAAAGDGTEFPSLTEKSDLSKLHLAISTANDNDRRPADLSRRRSDLRDLLERWQTLPSADISRNQADLERVEQAATQALANWRSGAGAVLYTAIDDARTFFSDLPLPDNDPEKSRATALKRAVVDEARCNSLLSTHASSTELTKNLNGIVQRATSRIDEINKDLARAVKDARTLANALAGIVPHIDGETCPVCDRNFQEQDSGPLSAHVSAKIASLTTEAGRLQALAAERAQESQILATAQRNLLNAANGQLSPEDLAEITVRKVKLADLVLQLRDAESITSDGSRIIAAAAAAHQALIAARRHSELSISILAEIQAAVQPVLGKSASSFEGIDHALQEAIRVTGAEADAAARVATLRAQALSEIDKLIRDAGQIQDLLSERQRAAAQMARVSEAFTKVESIRSKAKKVSDAANAVRSATVKKVFSTSLNKVWRDLFVRLAPSEQFVPAFKLPNNAGGNVEAVLETLHRSGKSSGPPGAMLSQGNLNTAALTLFLALHLSVPMRMPCLVLDDPVQSMDDVHIAQFAALLRTISKGMDRQIVIAIHERALFDYLTLELSPAFKGDSLITVEITRNFAGEAVVTPRAYGYEEDLAIAA